MVNFLYSLLKEYEFENDFWKTPAFGFWHIFYVVLVVGLIIGAAFVLKNKNEKTKKKVMDILPIAVLCVYIVDFFLRPIAFKEGDFTNSISSIIDKLPFHICTVLAPVAAFAQFNKKFEKIKEPIVILSIVGPLMYLTYPGTAVGDEFPFCYEVVQTMLYHGLLLAWGVLNISTGQTKITIKNWHKSLIGIAIISGWALLGNMMFSDMTSVSTWTKTGFDWFFQKGNLLSSDHSSLPLAIAMPFLVALAIFGMAMIIYGLYYIIKAIANKATKGSKKVKEN